MTLSELIAEHGLLAWALCLAVSLPASVYVIRDLASFGDHGPADYAMYGFLFLLLNLASPLVVVTAVGVLFFGLPLYLFGRLLTWGTGP